MITVHRKRSPRAPSISLDDAIDKVAKIYEKERCHAAPDDGVAQHLGYKNADNGAVASVFASMKYYGLLDRPRDKMLSVSRDYEIFLHAPDDSIKRQILNKWLKSPPLFSELLDRYTESLPSEKTLKFDLIQKGFIPAAADACVAAFRRSVDFAQYYEQNRAEAITDNEQEPEEQPYVVAVGAASFPQTNAGTALGGKEQTYAVAIGGASLPQTSAGSVHGGKDQTDGELDRIPVRLAGGRRAWIEVPIPFYAADKNRLKAQIDLLLTDDESDG